MNDVLAPVDGTQQRAAALNALGILSRLEERSPDRTGKRRQWITALMHLARPVGAPSDDPDVDPDLLQEVLTFLETLQGSSADPAQAVESVADEHDEDVQDDDASLPVQQVGTGPSTAHPPVGTPRQMQADEPRAPAASEEDAAQETLPESELAAWDAAPHQGNYTREEIDYVRTLQQQIHEREIARLQAESWLPSALGEASEQQLAPYPGQQSPQLPDGWWRNEGQVVQASEMRTYQSKYPPAQGPWTKGSAQQPSVSVERVQQVPAPPSVSPTERSPQPRHETEEHTSRARHARVENKQGQQLFAALALSLVAVGISALIALIFVSSAALLPVMGVTVAICGALTYAWAALLRQQGDGQLGRQRGEPVAWLRALRMCTLAVPVLALIAGSVLLTVVGALLPESRSHGVNAYAKRALRTAQSLALHR